MMGFLGKRAGYFSFHFFKKQNFAKERRRTTEPPFKYNRIEFYQENFKTRRKESGPFRKNIGKTIYLINLKQSIKLTPPLLILNPAVYFGLLS